MINILIKKIIKDLIVVNFLKMMMKTMMKTMTMMKKAFAFGVLFAALLLGEALTVWHFAGFVAVMGGTYLGTRRPVLVVPAVP